MRLSFTPNPDLHANLGGQSVELGFKDSASAAQTTHRGSETRAEEALDQA